MHTFQMLLQMVFASKHSIGGTFAMAITGIALVRNVGLLGMDFFTVDTFASSIFILAFGRTYPLVQYEVYHLFMSSPVAKVCKVGHAKGALIDTQPLMGRPCALSLSVTKNLFPAAFE